MNCKNCGHELGRNGYDTLMHVLPSNPNMVKDKCKVKHPTDDKWECACQNAELPKHSDKEGE